jgi:hypothetical protein
MTILTKDQRTFLDTTVQKARRQSEAAAAHAIQRLTVTEVRPGAHLTDPERVLRRELRSKAAQLGDTLETGAAPLLVADIGYEQWHRLLFARFLEVSGLLRHPEMGIPLTLEDCAELADELGEPDAWSVAARFASDMLPGVFRLTDPGVLVQYAREDLAALEALLASIPEETFRGEDALGWVYQFWQTAQKRAVNESGRKIGGADIAPVTQLFTENYMVHFLLQNSLGAWWAGKHPHSPLLDEWEFLRRLSDGTPVAGNFEEWPSAAADVTVMDPCCGSGHFLVAAFGMLWRMRAEEENLNALDAQDATLRDNIFGLELDPRCTQIAAFNLILEVWRQGGWRPVAAPQVECSGIELKVNIEEWTERFEGNPALRGSLIALHTAFSRAADLGSLITVPSGDDSGPDLFDFSSSTLRSEVPDDAKTILINAFEDVSGAAALLARKYTLVATNVPYLKRANQAPILDEHCATNYPRSKYDLATAFLERIYRGLATSAAVVAPHGWTFMSWYRRFRQFALEEWTFHVIAQLGPGAFTSISGEVVNADLFITTEGSAGTSSIEYFDLASVTGKQDALRTMQPVRRLQQEAANDPDFPLNYRIKSTAQLLQDYAEGFAGIQSGDYPRFGRMFWEVVDMGQRWSFQQSTVKSTTEYGGREHIFMWDEGKGPFLEFVQERLGPKNTGAWIRGTNYAGRTGVAISSMGSLPATIYTGELFDNNTAVILAKNDDDLPAIWEYAKSGDLSREVRKIDQSIKVTNSTFVKVPFDRSLWSAKASEGANLAKPSSEDPTQWLFRGSPNTSTEALAVAVSALVGYRWPKTARTVDALGDDDGIVVLPALAGERAADDRVRNILAVSYNSQWSTSVLNGLLSDAGGKPGDLAGWLRDGFFRHHCKVFHNRPFVWQVWDGLKDGFSVLLHYHRLNRATLEKLTYSTLGSWLARQQSELEAGTAGAEKRYTAALDLQRRLKLILEGQPPYDIYVRWKAMHEQPIGWEPDLDDGVRMNIRPFVNAGVLRSKVNVKWEKDRGTNPDGSDRINDLHPTLAERRAARQAQA